MRQPTSIERLSVLGAVLLLGLFAAHWDVAAANPGKADAVPTSSTALSLFPLSLQVPKIPQAVSASDGRTHLTYEILATNTGKSPITIAAVDVSSSAGSLLQYHGDSLTAHMSPLGDPMAKTTHIAPGAVVTVWIDVVLAANAAVPAELLARLSVEGEVTAANPAPLLVTRVDPTPSRRVSAPLAGSNWGVLEGCCDAANHHRRGQRSVDGRLRLPERFAIDFARFDKDGEVHRGEGKVNADYYGFGEPVLAVAEATVIDVLSRFADLVPEAPLPMPTLPDAGGNHIVLDLGDGAFAFYGHLKADSIKVKVGDKVRAGQVIAALGNNGSSTFAHLHFQLMDTRNFALSEGIPFRLERFDLIGRFDEKAERIVRASHPVQHHNELPLTWSIVDFPALKP
ncbi:MAG: M23 family metallopeptidase [Dokdonella sp.]